LPKKITLQPNPKLRRKQKKRKGPVSKVEKALVAHVIQDTPGIITTAQERGLATALRRPKEVIKEMIDEAREKFVKSSLRYVEIHKSATENALADGDNEQALKGSQWALTNISAEGARIIDKQNTETNTPKVLIGIRVGGVTTTVPTIEIAE
jgi:hypothetical protein